MEKQIFTMGYRIPAFNKNYVDFYGSASLMDADILLISPDSLTPRGPLTPRGRYDSWIKFPAEEYCYNVPTSRKYEKKVSHLKKEVTDFLQSGRSVFMLLSKKETYALSSVAFYSREGGELYSAYTKSNYDFSPISIGTLVSASGKNIIFSGNSLFSNFYEKFKKNLEYQLYIENTNEAQVLFTGKNKTKILGAIFKVKSGNLILLPFINYDKKKFIEYKGECEEMKRYWTKEATQFGKSLVKTLVDIDRALRKGGDKTPPPDWINETGFQSAQEQILQKDRD